MLLSTLILAGTLMGQSANLPANSAPVMDAEHRFLRTFWVELMRRDDDAELHKRRTREIHPESAKGPTISLERPKEIRIPDTF